MAAQNLDLGLINALARLHPSGIRGVAGLTGMVESNLSSALSGRRFIPRAKVSVLLDVLGTDGLRLLNDRVYFWTVGGDLEPLKKVVSICMPEGAELTGLWRQGGGVWDITRVLDNILLAIRDGQHRIIVKRTGISHLLSMAKPIGPETVTGLYWRQGQVGADTMVAIPSDRYGIWSSGEKIDAKEFDRILNVAGSNKGATWDEVRLVASQQGMSAQQVIDLILKVKKP